MTLLEAALACAKRNWAVFPCLPRQKNPATKNGVKDASLDVEQIKRWWKQNPSYNPAINLGLSGLTVMDVDGGLANKDEARTWLKTSGLPPTFAVRTGRRSSFGLQLYFIGLVPNRPYTDGRIKGEVRSSGYYVMAPGAIHPDSGEVYEILENLPLAPVPPLIIALAQKKMAKPRGRHDKIRIKESERHYYFVARAIELYETGLYGDGVVRALRWLNENRCDPPKHRAGEFEGIVEWVEQNVLPGLWKDDVDPVARLLNNPKGIAAWEGQLDLFDNNTEEALRHMIAVLAKEKAKPWQIERIVKASPLGQRLAEGCPAFIPDGHEGVE